MNRPRLLLLLGVVAMLAVMAVAGGWDWITDADRVEHFFTERGLLGPVVFVLLMWSLQPWGLPGALFMVPAAVVWPLPTAILLSWIGNLGASTIAFLFARFVARDWAQARLPERVRRWDDRLAAGGYVEVTLLRLLTGQIPPADCLLGVSTVRLTPFLVGTAIGIVPGIVLITAAGGSLVEWLATEPWRLVVATGTIAAVWAVARARARRSHPTDR